jgi:hypothetical protein
MLQSAIIKTKREKKESQESTSFLKKRSKKLPLQVAPAPLGPSQHHASTTSSDPRQPPTTPTAAT